MRQPKFAESRPRQVGKKWQAERDQECLVDPSRLRVRHGTVKRARQGPAIFIDLTA